MDDVHRLEIPTPFHVGRVNCYVFARDGLALLDPGPATEDAREALDAGLADLGFDRADVDRVLVTHPHMDHFGLANEIVESAGAEAVAHRDAARRLADPIDHFHREQAFFRPFLESMGVPEPTLVSAVTLPEAYTSYQEALAVDRELADGDAVDAGGVELTALHTPGHAPGSVCFLPEGVPADAEPVAFTGDHVLGHITPNPLLTLAPGTDDERTRSLPDYLDALAKLRDTDAEVGHGGHGDVIDDLDGRITETIDHHHDREERIADILRGHGPMTAHDVMQELFPDLPATEVFPGMSEVVGHLDLLEDETRVEIDEAGGEWLYSVR